MLFAILLAEWQSCLNLRELFNSDLFVKSLKSLQLFWDSHIFYLYFLKFLILIFPSHSKSWCTEKNHKLLELRSEATSFQIEFIPVNSFKHEQIIWFYRTATTNSLWQGRFLSIMALKQNFHNTWKKGPLGKNSRVFSSRYS